MMNPRYSVYTSDKTSPRSFGWLWFFRPAQALVSLIVLGLSAVSIAGLAAADGITCDIPGKMAWNLACAVLSLIVLAYLIFSSGTMRLFKLLPWWIFIQLGLDALMFIFWISAAGTSHFTCNDLCNACNAYDIYYDHLSCSCSSGVYSYWYAKRNTSPNPFPGLSAGLQKRRSSRRAKTHGGALVAREALDAIMVVLFFITLCGTAWWIWQNRDTSNSAAATTTPNAENGAAAQAAPMEEKKQDNAYNNGVPQQQPIGPVNGTPEQYSQQQQQQVYPQQPQQAYQGYPQQGQGYPQQPYPEQQQSPPPPFTGYYAPPEGQQRDVASSPPPPQQQQQQHDIPNYPTPTPEMQAEHRHT